jgi:hypothetical protein
VSSSARRCEVARRIRPLLLALPLLIGLTQDLQAQRRGGLSRARPTSVRQARTSSRSTPSRVATKPAVAPRGGTVRRSPRVGVQPRQSTSVRQSRTAVRVSPARSVPVSSVRTRRGDRLKDLPDRTQLYVNRKRFWYRRGRFYRKVYVSNDAYYEDVVAPVGAMVNEIPDDCESVDVDGLHYFDCIDVWFREVTEDGRVRYMVVDPPG